MTLQLSPSAKISKLTDIEDSIKGTVIAVGDGTCIDSFVKIKPTGGDGNIIIGQRVFINSGCVFYSGNGIVIGNDVAIAANCVFAPVNHAYQQKDQTIKAQRFKASKGGIIVEDDVWIGAGSVLLDGTILRKGVVIGAMSLVKGECPPYSIHAGNPLRLLGWRK